MRYEEAAQDVQRAADILHGAKAYAEALKYASPSASVLEIKAAIVMAMKAEDHLQDLLIEAYPGKHAYLKGKYVVITGEV